ncbi:MAG TPA: hypothetical protein PLE99_05550 [Candidatus Thiothrix moscowensis]|uniref:hypothetical protein n=1 Tax=unclassified Thiothrix TaxID=2636184 RepID=UPI0025DC5A33|nr:MULTISPECIES: hypothetical protein [unclassified Thiothrix]HRJ52208.1 hypothetical protein [Candidatus Thiothrix moscowensis]HRJ92523.1 hypothetical protein [Candidatus Thiothrix moscowensis]
MELNKPGVSLRRKEKAKTKRKPVCGGYCRWESASSGKSGITLHDYQRLAITRALLLHGFVRAVFYQPDGVVQHGCWRRV